MTRNVEKIKELNDTMRKAFRAMMLPGLPEIGLAVPKHGIPFSSVMTPGIDALDIEAKVRIITAVADFSVFDDDNDPYGEHDFGKIDDPTAGRVFWKIDYYARDMEHGAEDPADITKSIRVLTIMLASEY